MQKFSNYLLEHSGNLKDEINSKIINLMLCLNNKKLKENIQDEQYVYLTYSSNCLLIRYRDIISQEKIDNQNLENLNDELTQLNDEVLKIYENLDTKVMK